MCDICEREDRGAASDSFDSKVVPVIKAVGMVLSHDITEIRPGQFKGRAFKKGHIVRREDIPHLKRLGKEHLYVLKIGSDEMHENEAARAMADALAGDGVVTAGEPKEGKLNLVAEKDGLLKIHTGALMDFNMLGDVMCATLHTNMVVRKGQTVAGTRAIPLVVKKSVVEEAVKIAERARNSPSSEQPSGKEGTCRTTGVIEVKEIRKPKAGIVITGSEVYYGKIQDAFEPVIRRKIKAFGGEITGVHFAPDDAGFIEKNILELIAAGADLIITTGGMSVDPDDVTRFAIGGLCAEELWYGSPVLPGAMFLIAYLKNTELRTQNADKNSPGSGICALSSDPIPVLGIPACGMYAKITVLDIVLPRVLAGERIGRRELAELGHGGLCMSCKECRYPVCPFGK